LFKPRQFTSVLMSGKTAPLVRQLIDLPLCSGGKFVWSDCMADRPSDLAERMSDRGKAKASSTFTLPVDEARAKVRECLNQPAQGGYAIVVDQWWQLPDGQIEFTTRRLQSSN
jgi:hypothetical protein